MGSIPDRDKPFGWLWRTLRWDNQLMEISFSTYYISIYKTWDQIVNQSLLYVRIEGSNHTRFYWYSLLNEFHKNSFFVKKKLLSFIREFVFVLNFMLLLGPDCNFFFFFAMLYLYMYLEDQQESPPATHTKSTGSPRNLIQIMKWFYFKTNLSYEMRRHLFHILIIPILIFFLKISSFFIHLVKINCWQMEIVMIRFEIMKNILRISCAEV